jgi:hypothetical protein
MVLRWIVTKIALLDQTILQDHLCPAQGEQGVKSSTLQLLKLPIALVGFPSFDYYTTFNLNASTTRYQLLSTPVTCAGHSPSKQRMYSPTMAVNGSFILSCSQRGRCLNYLKLCSVRPSIMSSTRAYVYTWIESFNPWHQPFLVIMAH